MTKQILIVDDEESICWGLSKLCQQLGFSAQTASSAERGLELAESTNFDLVILDVRLPGMDGLTAIQEFKLRLENAPVITVTAFGDLQTAIRSIQNGAYEYIVKPFELDAVRSKIMEALSDFPLHDGEASELNPVESNEGHRLVGNSEPMQKVFRKVALTTTSRSPVLITGESGTGKELVARSIHQFSQETQGPFVAVNLAALSPSLAESELFGHVKGAFTGADSNRVGLIQKANGGTLFLDEVGDIPISLQVKLLRVLDLGEVTAVGSDTPTKVQFRLISATHRDLPALILEQRFREDLFYRIRTFQIRLPALRERKQDIPQLANYFLMQRDLKLQLSEDCVSELIRRDWPGNVRQLQSTVERAATFARGGVITAQHLDDAKELASESENSLETRIQHLVMQWTRQQWGQAPTDSGLYPTLLGLIETGIFPTAFELSERQYSAAARRLGVHRTTLKKKLDELGQDNGE